MGQSEGIDSSKACPLTPTLERKLFGNTVRREMIIAVSLAFVLTATGLVYVLMLPPALPPAPPPPFEPPTPLQLTPHGVITIDGDANFSDTALLEGWPGDGSPENPYIIDRLEIDLGGWSVFYCISINNTRVSFTISNCNITGASYWFTGMGVGIYLENVTNGELVNNTCNNNDSGITLYNSDYNTVANNTCTSNDYSGILLWDSDSNTVANNTLASTSVHYFPEGISLWGSNSNTVANNTCNNNDNGIYLYYSDYNTVAVNTCNNNDHGISLHDSHSNTVANNTCTSNDIGIRLLVSNSNTVANNTCNNNRIGIYLDDESYSNTVANNTCLINTELDTPGEYMTEEDETEESGPEVLLFIGFAGIIMLGAAWRMLSGIREIN